VDTVTTGRLRFAPAVLVRLGEELIPHPAQGIIELLKNAYDAEANRCTIQLHDVLFPGGTIVVEDDGNGMTDEQLLDNFLLIGHSAKRSSARTKRLHRRFVGEKGLGRLAALRLGYRARICSRPRDEPGVEYELDIDWREFDSVTAVEEVPLSIVTRPTREAPGVTVHIIDLKRPLSDGEVRSLTREALLLSDPFAFVHWEKHEQEPSFPLEGEPKERSVADGSFQVEVRSKDFRDLQSKMQSGYLNDAAYRLKAYVYADGSAQFVLDDQNKRRMAEETSPPGTFKTVPAAFDLWVYMLGGGSEFSPKKFSLKEIKEWLGGVGGVHMYYRGIKVKPYGDPGDDWLKMNLARSSHQEDQPSTNTVFGRIAVDDATNVFEQPTSRLGFMENEAFANLTAFAQQALRWMFNQRRMRSEQQRQAAREKDKVERAKAVSEAKAEIRALVPAPQRQQAEQVIERLAKVDQKAAARFQQDLLLYRTMATVGTTYAIYSHQAEQPITTIRNLVDTLEERGRRHAPEVFEQHLARPLSTVRKTVETLRAYTNFPLQHLRRSKRETKDVDVAAAWEGVVEVFRPIAERSKVRIETDWPSSTACVFGSVALIEAIAANLLTNSIKALRDVSPAEGRIIRIAAEVGGAALWVTHGDNGPGIVDLSLEEIWIPGRTSYENGTGFGLTIVRDSTSDLGGRVEAKKHGAYGGAEFTFQLPLTQETP